jgi:redox-sensing transcriptional repressor
MRPPIPGPVIRRLPRYLTHVREMKKAQEVWVSSADLAGALGLTTSTVRQDISHLNVTGVPKRGYRVLELERVLGEVLGAGAVHRVAIIGAGLLGRALALHAELADNGFDVCAIFDNAKGVVGRKVGSLTVQSIDDLNRIVRDCRVELGVIAVPQASAQSVADLLVKAGVRGLLNLAHAHLHVPRGIHIVEARLLARLQQLAYAVRASKAPRSAV